jgi:hypothetical protein
MDLRQQTIKLPAPGFGIGPVCGQVICQPAATDAFLTYWFSPQFALGSPTVICN